MFSDEQLDDLKLRSIEVLKLNRHKKFTKPSSKLYPHQWNWDSAFIAIGLSHIDEELAQQEILSLLSGQWGNGMIPHIVYSDSSANYLPDENFWDSKKIKNSPKNISTSGITQPPVLSFAALKVCENSKDKNNSKKFLKEIYPKLISYQRFLNEDRNLTGDDLICVLHPWESGLDNSPRWDKSLQNIQIKNYYRVNRVDDKFIPKHQRPTDKDYQLYFFIAEKLKEQDYKIKDYLSLPVVMQDVMFNALAILSLESLITISEFIEEDSSQLIYWKNKLSNAINTKLWDEKNKRFYDWDVISNRAIDNLTLANCIPLILNSLSQKQIDSIVSHLKKNGDFWKEDGFPLSAIPLSSPEFNPKNYWRGPVWINMNWLLIQGLEKHGFSELVTELSNETIRLVLESGFYEYFDPIIGEGCGSDNFSWTAALIIDLINKHQTK
ncbi:MAG: hypothetical protein JSW63_03115 [Ignavibacterium sp.]|nr:MAG: hypothetical protein JSW63_03115 [Ignavibacterium sp.]